jgi:hypothetical protein
MRMLLSAILSAACFLTCGPALSQPAAKSNICIRSYQIDHTKAPNDRTLIFYMKNGAAYQSTLVSNCPQLGVYGFSYMPAPPDQICGNLQSIRVIRTGSVCVLGPLVPITPKAGGSY